MPLQGLQLGQVAPALSRLPILPTPPPPCLLGGLAVRVGGREGKVAEGLGHSVSDALSPYPQSHTDKVQILHEVFWG